MTDTARSLGDFLRHEREKRSITIEQVASATKINVRLLHSLEADQYGDMPAKPFIRGFVNSYCRFIGLDSKEVLTRFDDFIARKSSERPSRDAGHSGYAFEKREGEQSRTMLWVVMGTFTVVGAILVLVLKPSFKHHRKGKIEELKAAHSTPVPGASPTGTSAAPGPSLASVTALGSSTVPLVLAPSPLPASSPSALPKPSPTPSPSPSPSPSRSASPAPSPRPSVAHSGGSLLGPLLLPPWSGPVPSPKASTSPKASPSPVPSSSPSPGAEKPDPLNSGVNLKSAQIKYKLIVKALEDVWVRYQADGRPTMKFPLRKDRVLVLRAEKEVRFQVSNPDAVTVNLNSGGARSMKEVRGVTSRQGNATLILPAEAVEKTQEPFPGEKALPLLTPQARSGAPSEPATE